MSAAPAVFEDVGPMGPHVAAKDWAATPLGAPSTWSPLLRGYVDMILRMADPACIFWGPELIQLYNLGYSHIMGPRHPRYLGERLRDCWPDTYDTVYPMMQRTLAGETVTVEEALIPVTRFGFTEETYFTFSFVPLRNEAGAIEGLIQPISEVTKPVLARRRLATVRELSPRVGRDTDPIAAAAAAFAADANDVAFALVYVAPDDDEGAPPRFATAVGLPGDVPGLAAVAAEAARTTTPAVIDDLRPYLGDAVVGPWPEPTRRAMVVPLQRSAGEAALGALVLGISPRLDFDETYRAFFESCARELAADLTLRREQRRREELTAELARRAEALTELDRAKTAFFSNVSHELRTPLTLLLGPIDDALADAAHPLGAEQRRRLELARRSGDRLYKLVNSLLDFARIEARRTRARFVPTDLGALTTDLVSAFRSLVERAGLALTVDVEPMGEPVWVDPEMWEKIVLNLLSNAFKFTFEGTIAVAVRPRGAAVEVTVKDSGVGVPERDRDRVFDRFHRVEGARGRSYEGTGIGLALVRELVALHGGTITLASAVGQGSTFTIRLPLGAAHVPAEQLDLSASADERRAGARDAYVREAEGWLGGEAAPPAAAAPATSDGPRDARPRIVLADDNADMRGYVGRLLADDYRVEAVANGAEALAAVTREATDLVVSDVMMPELDGFGLVAALRADPRTRGTPIILLSARAGEESRVEGLASGADDYLPKPFHARELLARVQARLEIARLHASIAGRLEQLVTERTAQLVEANRELESFSYSVSHDLRAPLRHILGFAQLLERRAMATLDDVSQRHLRTIAAAAERGGQLVDDLLAFARLGRAELTMARVSLAALAASVRDELALEAGGRVVEWELGPLPDVAGDASLLRLVLRNLLANALKYTRPRAVARIVVGSRPHGGEHELYVEDNGVGFDMRYVDKLFGVFQRLHASEEFEGNGIGLALVRRIVQRHGGRSWGEGTPGAGATFHVTLPAAR